MAGFVEEDAAVGIAVEADAEVAFFRAHFFLEHREVGFDERVGVVGEGAGDVKKEGDDLEVGESFEDGGDQFSGHAVAGVDDDLKRALELEELEDVFFVGAPEVLLGDFSVEAGLSEAEKGGDAFDVVESAGGADGFGLGAGDFEAVVLDGVVGGGGLDSADRIEMVDGEIDHRGIDHADVDDVHAGGADAVDEGFGEGGGTGPHVAADDHGVFEFYFFGGVLAAALEVLAGGVADFPGGFFV